MRKVEDKSKEEIVKIGRKIGAAFAEAEKKNIPCVLDTDTPLKVKNTAMKPDLLPAASAP